MLNGIFELNSYEIEDVQGNMNSVDSELTGTNDEAKQNFISFKQSGVFSKGIKKIHNQMESISGSLKLMNKAIQRGTASAFAQEATLASEISSLEIPKDFAVNNDLTQKTFKAVALKKKDGQSVNKGIASHVVQLADLNAIKQKVRMFNQINESGDKVELDVSKLSSNNIKIFNLSDIGKGDTQKVDANPKYIQAAAMNLKNMNNGNNVAIKAEIAGSSKGTPITIQDINKNSKTDVKGIQNFDKSNFTNLNSMNFKGQTILNANSINEKANKEKRIDIDSENIKNQSFISASSISAKMLDTNKDNEHNKLIDKIIGKLEK